jgi:cathepsin L
MSDFVLCVFIRVMFVCFCVTRAFASTAVIESHVAIQTGLLFDLSTEQIAMCSPNPDSCGGTGGCEGATSEIGL